MKAWLIALVVTSALAHETLTTTVLFDREIVRILNKHCVMCHVEGGPSFPLETYEQAWIAGRKIRASAIARHMPPWAAVPGYGQFLNDNNLTLRESQFIISWVEGLGPRNAGTVFTNIVDPDSPRKKDVQAHTDFGHWQLGEPTHKIEISARLPQESTVARVTVGTGLNSLKQIASIEYMPGNRRTLHAARFYIQETNQWIGSWTPWYGYQNAPRGAAISLPANVHVIAELHYRASAVDEIEKGTLGLKFADVPSAAITGLILESRKPVRLAGATTIAALQPELPRSVETVEVSARRPNGSVDILLYLRNPPTDWPTPYVLKSPVRLPVGTELTFSVPQGIDAKLRVQSFTPGSPSRPR